MNTILATLVAEAFIQKGFDYDPDWIREVAQREPDSFVVDSLRAWLYNPIRVWLCENWKVDFTGSDILPDDVATAFRLTFL